MSARRFPYDIAISFAGPDRGLAEQIASGLTTHGVSVFYDGYEEARLWGTNLFDHLEDVYTRQARFCLLLVSQHYRKRVWTNHERKSAQARAMKEKGEYLLPVLLDRTRLTGISQTTAYVDGRTKTGDDIVALVLRKLALRADAEGGPDSTSRKLRYRPSPTVIQFFDGIGSSSRPTRRLNVGVPTDLVLSAEWAGDDIELCLGSTAVEGQSTFKYEAFLEDYSLAVSGCQRTDLDGFDQAQWLYRLDAALLGFSAAEAKIRELLEAHNSEIRRLREAYVSP